MKIILALFIIISLAVSIPTAIAQEISLGEKAEQKRVEVTINSDGDVHVKHIVKFSKSPKQVELIDGVKSNLTVVDEDGNEQQHAVIGADSGILISPSSEDTVIEYDLENSLTLKENIWTWDVLYLESTAFIFPEEVNLIFVNDRPVYLGEKEGMMCHGCQMKLEYTINEPRVFNDVKWEDKEFQVETITFADTRDFVFDQPSKTISFQVDSNNDFVTTIIPLELLWKPYQVYLGDKKIFFHEYINNGTHVWLNFRPDTSGQITIIGTTVVPEFPLIAPLAIGFLIVIAAPFLKKFNLR